MRFSNKKELNTSNSSKNSLLNIDLLYGSG